MLSLFSGYPGRILASAGFVLAEVGPASFEDQSPLFCSVLLIFEHVVRCSHSVAGIHEIQSVTAKKTIN